MRQNVVERRSAGLVESTMIRTACRNGNRRWTCSRCTGDVKWRDALSGKVKGSRLHGQVDVSSASVVRRPETIFLRRTPQGLGQSK